MLHRLCGPPSIPLSFNLAAVLPRRCAYSVSCDTEELGSPTSSTHRLQRGLPGYLILFAPHAFAPQRQSRSRAPPTPPLRPVIPNNARPLRITAAAGTKLAGASSPATVIIVAGKRALQPEGLHHSRGIAGSGLRPLSNIPYCCLP